MHAETPNFDKTMNYSFGVFFLQNGVENSNCSYFANTCMCMYNYVMLLHNKNECHSLLSFPDNCCIV